MKLLNKGKRTIIHGTFRFAPGGLVEFKGDSEEVGKKLYRLYKGELVSFDDAVQQFDNPSPMEFPSSEPSKKGPGRPKATKDDDGF